jgi:hypothetical protein
MGVKNSIYIKKFQPGYVSAGNYSDTLNPGFKTFKNWRVDITGKLTKPFGWSVVKGYDEQGKDNGNLKIDFDRLATGAGGYPNISTFHCKPFVTAVAGAEVIYRDVLSHRIVNNINEIWRTRYDNTNTVIEDKKISVDGQLVGVCNVRFVESPDHVYIINDYVKGTVSGTVYKYKYAKDLKQFDVDLIQNISIAASVFIRGTFVPNGTGTVGMFNGHFKYFVIPVYNTSAEGFADTPDPAQFIEIITTNSTTGKALRIDIKSTYDPFIVGYKIYRTKINGQDVVVKSTVETFLGMFKTVTVDNPGYNPIQKIPPYYFLKYIPKPNNAVNFNDWVPLIEKGKTFTDELITDTLLGEMYAGSMPVNFCLNQYRGTYGMTIPSTAATSGLGMLCTCGTYADDSLFLGGDARYPKKLFKSDFGKSDYFGDIIYDIKYASLENMQSAIEQVGSNIFVWCKNGGLVKLAPTQNADVPYVVEPLDNGIGCDSLNSIAILNRMAYFIFKGKMYAVNEFGQYKEISGGVSSVLSQATSEIILKTNNKDNYVKIMFRIGTGTSSNAVNIDFYPTLGMWIEHTGLKDIFRQAGATASPSSQDERYQLVNYDYLPDLNEEWGVNLDGDIVKRSADYNNVGNDKCQWLNCSSYGITPVTTYPVTSTWERGLHFNAKAYINTLIFYGASPVKYDYALDDSIYVFKAANETREIIMTKLGYEVPINQYTNLLLIKMIHDTAAAIDFDYVEIIYNGTQKITVKNTVGAGE